MIWEMPQKIFPVIAICLLFLTSRAAAWFDSGHRQTALIAWDDLTPATKAKIIEILKQHPQYEKVLLDQLPSDSDADATARYAFTSAATWPDAVKNISNPMHATHSHPNWHYIDIPYAIDGQ